MNREDVHDTAEDAAGESLAVLAERARRESRYGMSGFATLRLCTAVEQLLEDARGDWYSDAELRRRLVASVWP